MEKFRNSLVQVWMLFSLFSLISIDFIFKKKNIFVNWFLNKQLNEIVVENFWKNYLIAQINNKTLHCRNSDEIHSCWQSRSARWNFGAGVRLLRTPGHKSHEGWIRRSVRLELLSFVFLFLHRLFYRWYVYCLQNFN